VEGGRKMLGILRQKVGAGGSSLLVHPTKFSVAFYILLMLGSYSCRFFSVLILTISD
jgi:hypothetical protein